MYEYIRTYVRIDGLMHEYMYAWMNGCMNGNIYEFANMSFYIQTT